MVALSPEMRDPGFDSVEHERVTCPKCYSEYAIKTIRREGRTTISSIHCGHCGYQSPQIATIMTGDTQN